MGLELGVKSYPFTRSYSVAVGQKIQQPPLCLKISAENSQ